MVTRSTSGRYYVPSFVSCSFIGDVNSADEYVLCNEASGQYYRVNRTTVHLIEMVNRFGSVNESLTRLNIPETMGLPLAEAMEKAGILVCRGRTAEPDAPIAPLEAALISARIDLFDAAKVSQKLAWIGTLLYSRTGLFIWFIVLLAACNAFLGNLEKARVMLASPGALSTGSGLMFVAVFLLLKVVHELGHALAYQTTCRREGLAPGPIRMGIAVFAMMPFPFTDVTGAWRLRSRWRRATISAGGIYAESLVIGLLALFWAASRPGDLQLAVLQAAILSGGLTLAFNLNPAVKLDGYYLLSDITGRANLAGRSSVAARTCFARALGAALAAPDSADLGYWVIAYLYRISLFAGIFLLARQFDPGLGFAVLAVVVTLFVVRPLIASLRFAAAQGIKPLRGVLVSFFLAGTIALMLVPMDTNLRFDGRLETHTSVYLIAPGRGQLVSATEVELRLSNPDLQEDIEAARAQVELLDLTARALLETGTEVAVLQNDRVSAAAYLEELSQRAEELRINLPPGSVWTPMAARELQGAWLRPDAENPLGAISQPTGAPHFTLWRDQSRFEPGDIDLEQSSRIRLVSDPFCQITVRLDTSRQDVSESGLFVFQTEAMQAIPDCIRDAPAGSAAVAAVNIGQHSIVSRGWLALKRLMQDRLPVFSDVG